MIAALTLAAVTGVAPIPVAKATRRFPDDRAWLGAGQQRTINMLRAIESRQGNAMRTRGPGPQQLRARWRSGLLTAEERVAVLLGGGTFHDPALLPVYVEGLRSAELRERQAAAVGLSWLLGEPAPDVTEVPLDAPVWEQGAALAEALAAVTRERSLVRVWIDSYMAARGLPHSGRLTLHRKPADCLRAILEIAQPEDVNDIIALWPHLDYGDRFPMVTALEIILVQRFDEVHLDQSKPGSSFANAVGVLRADAAVAQSCGWIDGPTQALINIGRTYRGTNDPPRRVELLVAPLLLDYSAMWIVPAELLTAYGADAVTFDRQRLEREENDTLRRRVRNDFPLTKQEWKTRRRESNRFRKWRQP